MDAIHTVVREPLVVRKVLLESALCASELVKAQEDLKKLGEERVAVGSELRRVVQQLQGGVEGVGRVLPEVPAEFAGDAVRVVRGAVQRARGGTMSGFERERLERDVQEIRKRIAKLAVH